MADRTDNGGRLRILSILDEYSRECLTLHVARKLKSERELPVHIRSDNGSEFIAKVLQKWLAQHQVKTLYIEPGSPWQNGHVESFNGSLRDECLNRELMLSVAEARVLIEDYRLHYNQKSLTVVSVTVPRLKPVLKSRLHSAYGCLAPRACTFNPHLLAYKPNRT